MMQPNFSIYFVTFSLSDTNVLDTPFSNSLNLPLYSVKYTMYCIDIKLVSLTHNTHKYKIKLKPTPQIRFHFGELI